MQSSVETLDGNRVRLIVEVNEDELSHEIDAAFKRMAKQARLPGFRPGRVPRRLLEMHLGPEAGRAEALRSCLPTYYEQAVLDKGIDVIASPEIEIVSGERTGPVRFDAVVEVRPVVTISGYEGLEVKIPNPIPPPEEISADIDGFRRQFAELSTVSRSAVDSDHLRIDIHSTLGGEVIEGLTTSDYDYELGQGAVVPEIDDNLRGASAGDILEFSAAHPDPDSKDVLRFRVLVKEVKETILPELDDDFVAANSEYETVEEFQVAVYERRSTARTMAAMEARRQATDQALASLVDEDIPEVMIESDIARRLRSITDQLEQGGHSLEEYLESLGKTEQQLMVELREVAETATKVDLALRAVATNHGLEPDDAALDAEIRLVANITSQELTQSNTLTDEVDDTGVVRGEVDDTGVVRGEVDDAGVVSGEVDDADVVNNVANDSGVVTDEQLAELRESLRRSGMLQELKSAMSKSAAMKWIDGQTVLLDPQGAVIDPQLLKRPES